MKKSHLVTLAEAKAQGLTSCENCSSSPSPAPADAPKRQASPRDVRVVSDHSAVAAEAIDAAEHVLPQSPERAAGNTDAAETSETPETPERPEPARAAAKTSAEGEVVRCAGIAASTGLPCKNYPKVSLGELTFCHSHRWQDPLYDPARDDVPCKGFTENGELCAELRVAGEQLCPAHRFQSHAESRERWRRGRGAEPDAIDARSYWESRSHAVPACSGTTKLSRMFCGGEGVEGVEDVEGVEGVDGVGVVEGVEFILPTAGEFEEIEQRLGAPPLGTGSKVKAIDEIIKNNSGRDISRMLTRDDITEDFDMASTPKHRQVWMSENFDVVLLRLYTRPSDFYITLNHSLREGYKKYPHCSAILAEAIYWQRIHKDSPKCKPLFRGFRLADDMTTLEARLRSMMASGEPRFLPGFTSFSELRRIAKVFLEREDQRKPTPVLLVLTGWRRGIRCHPFSVFPDEKEVLFGRALRCRITAVEVVAAKAGWPRHLRVTLKDLGFEDDGFVPGLAHAE